MTHTQQILEHPAKEPHPNGKGPPDHKAEPAIPEIAAVACRFVKQTNRPALIYQLGAGDPARDRPDVPITSRTVEQVEAAVDDQTFRDLDLVIQSTGGDIHAAFRMMALLRSRVSDQGKLIAWVPRRAQSSATLLCLGADEIQLGELASLGPLDAQIRRGTTDVGTPDYISALHLLKGLNRLQQFALETFDEVAAHLYDHQANREELLKYSVEFSSAITAPLFSRIDSEKVGYWDQMLRTGKVYGCRLLEHGKLIRDCPPGIDLKQHIAQVVHHLVFDYSSHELALGLCELNEELHLDAHIVEGEFRALTRQFGRYGEETLIMLVRPIDEKTFKKTPIATWADWQSADLTPRDVAVKVDDTAFGIRIGLYRPTVTPRNPWRKSLTRVADASSRFLAGSGASFDLAELEVVVPPLPPQQRIITPEELAKLAAMVARVISGEDEPSV